MVLLEVSCFRIRAHGQVPCAAVHSSSTIKQSRLFMYPILPCNRSHFVCEWGRACPLNQEWLILSPPLCLVQGYSRSRNHDYPVQVRGVERVAVAVLYKNFQGVQHFYTTPSYFISKLTHLHRESADPRDAAAVTAALIML